MLTEKQIATQANMYDLLIQKREIEERKRLKEIEDSLKGRDKYYKVEKMRLPYKDEDDYEIL